MSSHDVLEGDVCWIRHHVCGFLRDSLRNLLLWVKLTVFANFDFFVLVVPINVHIFKRCFEHGEVVLVHDVQLVVQFQVSVLSFSFAM